MHENDPSHVGHRQRLRERFIRAGLAGFSEHEVIELLLTLAIPRRDTKPIAKALLNRFRTLRGILDAPKSELTRVKGVGEVAWTTLRIVRDSANYYLQQRAQDTVKLTKQENLYEFWRHRLGGLQHEVFEAAFLDSAGMLLPNGVERLEEGIVDRAAVYPRRGMEAALQENAAAIIVARNHPNKHLEPPEQDKLLTRALVLAVTTLQINLFDHLIVSANDVFSFRRAGLL